MKKLFVLTIATWFGSGLIPSPKLLKDMAGTYGSISALPLCALLVYLARDINEQTMYKTDGHWLIYVIWVAIIFLLGQAVIEAAERALGPRTDCYGQTKIHDQNQIVIDEVVGMLITCLPLTWLQIENWWLVFILALIYFRFFDIVKFWPARIFSRMQESFGIMMDDVVAGIYSAIFLYSTIKIFNV